MKVIGLAGYSGSGRTTIANHIHRWCSKHEHDCLLLSFSKVPVGPRTSMKSVHEQAQETIAETLIALYNKERDTYNKLCEYNLESNFKETVVVIDDVSFLDDLKFLEDFKALTVFVDASQRLNIPSLQVAKEHLANAITKGKYPVTIFKSLLDNNCSQTKLYRLMDKVTPNLIYG